MVSGDVLDDTAWRNDSSGNHYFVRDALGTVVAMTDQAGNLQTQYTYEPFGNTTTSSGTSNNALQFTGRENDGTGLYFLRSRYYSPTLQRFISEDPLEFVDGPNRYMYAQDDPVNKIDLDELSTTVVYYPTGSAHIVIRPGDGGDFWGFWPEPTTMPESLVCMLIPCGTVHGPTDEGPTGTNYPSPLTVTIPTSPRQEQMMREFIQKWRERYNLIHRNCADFVLRTLEEAGFHVKWWLYERHQDPITGGWVFYVLKSGWYDIN